MTMQAGKTGRMPRVLGFVALLAVAVLGYGYWHAATHASFYISVDGLTRPAEQGQYGPVATVALHNAAGEVLARGVVDEKYNYVRLLHPDVGDCHAIESAATTSPQGRTAWQACFARLSTWIPTWARDVHQAEVVYGDQRFAKIPVTVSESGGEWALWWVPLPHVGGKPYTYFSATIRVDVAKK